MPFVTKRIDDFSSASPFHPLQPIHQNPTKHCHKPFTTPSIHHSLHHDISVKRDEELLRTFPIEKPITLFAPTFQKRPIQNPLSTCHCTSPHLYHSTYLSFLILRLGARHKDGLVLLQLLHQQKLALQQSILHRMPSPTLSQLRLYHRR